MTDVTRARSEEPQDSLAEAEGILGFPPDLLANIVGVSYPDPRRPGFKRQDYLKEANGLFSVHGGLPAKLVHDKDNKYDSDAIEVYVPTVADAAGNFSVWRQPGFVATRGCTNPKCFHSWGGKAKSLPACPKCGFDASQPINYLNAFIADIMRAEGIKELLSTGKDNIFSFGIVWISYGSGGKSIGMRLGYRFDNHRTAASGFMEMTKPLDDPPPSSREPGTGELPPVMSAE